MRGPRQPAGAALAKKNARLAREGLSAEDDAGLKAAAVEATRRAQAYMDNMAPEKLERNPKGSDKYNKRLSDRYDLYLEEEEYAYRRSKLAKRAGDESSDSDDEKQPPSKKIRAGSAAAAAAVAVATRILDVQQRLYGVLLPGLQLQLRRAPRRRTTVPERRHVRRRRTRKRVQPLQPWNGLYGLWW